MATHIAVELVSSVEGVRVLDSVKALRRGTGLGLADAKALVDRGLRGPTPVDILANQLDQLVEELTGLGWTVRVGSTSYPARPQPPSWLDRQRIAAATVLAQQADTDGVTLIVGRTEVPLQPGDQLAIPVSDDFVLAEPLAHLEAVAEGWRVRVEAHDAEGLALLVGCFAVGERAVFVRGAPEPGGGDGR